MSQTSCGARFRRRARLPTALRVALGAAMVVGTLAGPAAAVQAASPVCTTPYHPDIDASEFHTAAGKPNPINNPFYPLQPGTTFIYSGIKDGQHLHETVHVTGRKKPITGVQTTVVEDRVTIAGQLEEFTLDFFAQDRQGTVWYFGEFASNFQNGKLLDHSGSWQAGSDGAKPGIIMQAHPHVGDAYRQEFRKSVAEDVATVQSSNTDVKVPFGTFDDDHVLQTREFSCIETGVELKFYARGVGNVLTRSLTEQERVELVDVRHAAD